MIADWSTDKYLIERVEYPDYDGDFVRVDFRGMGDGWWLHPGQRRLRHVRVGCTIREPTDIELAAIAAYRLGSIDAANELLKELTKC
jgi:hypothetical protein